MTQQKIKKEDIGPMGIFTVIYFTLVAIFVYIGWRGSNDDWERRLVETDKTHHWTIDPSTGERSLEPISEGEGES